MKILVIGGGGREHALVWKLRQSPRITRLYCAPGNGGIAADAECMPADLKDVQSLVRLATRLNPDLTVVGPELPLTLGIGIVRDLPDPGPSGALPSGALDGVPLRARTVLGTASIGAAALAALREGDVVPLDTRLDGSARLTLAGRTFARGTCGVADARSVMRIEELCA